MSKEEWFEGHRIPKNNVYMIIIGKLPGNNTDITTNKYQVFTRGYVWGKVGS